MNDLLFRLASAIATAEGFFVEGVVPQLDNSPGDLRAAPWLKNPALKHGFWVARSVAEGVGGLYHQLALDIARGFTLRQLIYAWAPPNDANRTENYLKETARRTGLPYLTPEEAGKEQPLWDYLTIEQIP
jgi:hypothetical protein